MANLKARKATGKCEICWQRITDETNMTRPSMWYHGKLYHQECWKKRFRQRKTARTMKAKTKRSF